MEMDFFNRSEKFSRIDKFRNNVIREKEMIIRCYIKYAING